MRKKPSKFNANPTLNWVKKIKCLEFLNTNCCKVCGESDIVKLCFHHKEGFTKDIGISKILRKSFELIKKELVKCEVLCQNCHQELHYIEEISTSNANRSNKFIFLEFIGKNKCEECGYNKCIDCLNFHHTIPESKTIDFRLFHRKIKSVSEIADYIKNELLTCQLLCRNCHASKHSTYYYENEETIKEKLKVFKGLQKRLIPKDIIDLYNSGLSKSDIARKFEVGKSTIRSIINRYK